MIDARTLSITDPIYTYSDEEICVHVASARLRRVCLAIMPEVFLTPVSIDLANKFLSENTISMDRVFALTPGDRHEPILYCRDGKFTDGRPDVFLVDGHHRFVRAALEGQSMIEAWVLSEAQWRPFQIFGLPEITGEQLKSQPVLSRSYWRA